MYTRMVSIGLTLAASAVLHGENAPSWGGAEERLLHTTTEQDRAEWARRVAGGRQIDRQQVLEQLRQVLEEEQTEAIAWREVAALRRDLESARQRLRVERAQFLQKQEEWQALESSLREERDRQKEHAGRVEWMAKQLTDKLEAAERSQSQLQCVSDLKEATLLEQVTWLRDEHATLERVYAEAQKELYAIQQRVRAKEILARVQQEELSTLQQQHARLQRSLEEKDRKLASLEQERLDLVRRHWIATETLSAREAEQESLAAQVTLLAAQLEEREALIEPYGLLLAEQAQLQREAALGREALQTAIRLLGPYTQAEAWLPEVVATRGEDATPWQVALAQTVQSLQGAQASLEELQEQYRGLQQEIAQKEQDLHLERSQHEHARSTLRELAGAHIRLAGELSVGEDSAVVYTRSEGPAAAPTAQHTDSLRDQVASAVDAARVQLRRAQESLRQCREVPPGLHATLEELEARLNQEVLEGDSSPLHAWIAENEAAIQELQGEARALESTLADLASGTEVIQGERQQQQAALAALEAARAAAEQELARRSIEYSEQLRDAEAQRAQLATEHQAQGEELSTLAFQKEQLEQLLGQLEELRLDQQLDSKNVQLAALRAELEAGAERQAALERQCATLEAELASLHTCHAELEGAHATQTEDLLSLEAQKERHLEELARAHAQIAEVCEERTQLLATLESLQALGLEEQVTQLHLERERAEHENTLLGKSLGELLAERSIQQGRMQALLEDCAVLERALQAAQEGVREREQELARQQQEHIAQITAALELEQQRHHSQEEETLLQLEESTARVQELEYALLQVEGSLRAERHEMSLLMDEATQLRNTLNRVTGAVEAERIAQETRIAELEKELTLAQLEAMEHSTQLQAAEHQLAAWLQQGWEELAQSRGIEVEQLQQELGRVLAQRALLEKSSSTSLLVAEQLQHSLSTQLEALERTYAEEQQKWAEQEGTLSSGLGELQEELAALRSAQADALGKHEAHKRQIARLEATLAAEQERSTQSQEALQVAEEQLTAWLQQGWEELAQSRGTEVEQLQEELGRVLTQHALLEESSSTSLLVAEQLQHSLRSQLEALEEMYAKEQQRWAEQEGTLRAELAQQEAALHSLEDAYQQVQLLAQERASLLAARDAELASLQAVQSDGAERVTALEAMLAAEQERSTQSQEAYTQQSASWSARCAALEEELQRRDVRQRQELAERDQEIQALQERQVLVKEEFEQMQALYATERSERAAQELHRLQYAQQRTAEELASRLEKTEEHASQVATALAMTESSKSAAEARLKGLEEELARTQQQLQVINTQHLHSLAEQEVSARDLAQALTMKERMLEHMERSLAEQEQRILTEQKLREELEARLADLEGRS